MHRMNNKILKLRLDWGDYVTYQLFDSLERGCVSLSNYEDETWIHGLYVDDKYRHQGVATELLNTVEQYAEHEIKVGIKENAPKWLSEFYKKRGYIIDR